MCLCVCVHVCVWDIWAKKKEKRVMKEAELASKIKQNASVYFILREKHNALG